MERSAYMLPVAVGCSYNGCLFCGLFKHLKYRELPLSQIEEEINRVVKANGNPETVFLGDGNAFGIDYENMKHILRYVKSSFSNCKRIHMDATVTDIAHKTDEQLKEMYDLGVRLLYLGIETGLDDVLLQMNKDHHTMAEAAHQIERLHKAGIDYAAHIMTGILVFFPRISQSYYNIHNFSSSNTSIKPLYKCCRSSLFFIRINYIESDFYRQAFATRKTLSLK